MNDSPLKDLLGEAADGHRSGPTPYDVAGDLGRGHRALARSRRRRGAGALAALAVVGVVGVGTTLLHDPPAGTVVPDTDTGAPAAIVPLAEPLVSGPYTLDAAPEGWALQGGRADHVTIAPTDGSVGPSVDDFEGKLVVMYDQNPLGGDEVAYDGRTFRVGGDSGYVQLAVATRPGEPRGAVRLQYPADAGWSQDQMVQLLDSVHLGAGAQAGRG